MKFVKKEGNLFFPSESMKKFAWINDEKVYKKAGRNPIKFWEDLASKGISWDKKWKIAYKEKLPFFEWFVGAKLNVCYNCLDRHLNDKAKKTALIFVPEPKDEKIQKLTYEELYVKVNKLALLLKKEGVKKNDVVAIYLPLIPEAIISMLACARIGAIHSVVFSAFSANALKTRLIDGKVKLLITANGYYRKGEKENLEERAFEAVRGTLVKKIILVDRLKKKSLKKQGAISIIPFNDIDKMENYCKPLSVNSNHPLFILYSSGTTGKPKGIIHDTGGYITQAYWTTKWNFNLKDDIMWCTADVGWITGHTYACYGPLVLGETTLIYEGAPNFPKYDRWWKIIEENKVNVLYTAPTAIRMFMKVGEKWLENYNLDSLKILGTVGEPIDKTTWKWYFEKIGKKRCPIIDTWWQTETGGTLINALPGIGPFVPMVAGNCFPGTKHIIVDDDGKEVKPNKKGYLVQLSPFAPGMLHGIFRNKKRYRKTYWSKFKYMYNTGDGAFKDENGLIRITGRIDDVMKVAGHRLSTAEIEDSLSKNKNVAESAIVPANDEIKGNVPVAFVVLKKDNPSKELKKQLLREIEKSIGPIARPKEIYFVHDVPKTRSGKIMRRVLRSLLNKEELGELSTLINPEAIEEIKKIVNKK